MRGRRSGTRAQEIARVGLVVSFVVYHMRSRSSNKWRSAFLSVTSPGYLLNRYDRVIEASRGFLQLRVPMILIRLNKGSYQ